jgi:hypothetical protein
MSRKEHTIDHTYITYSYLSLSYYTEYRCTCSYLDHYIELLETLYLSFHPIFKSQDRSPPKWRLLQLLPSLKLRGCLMVEPTSSMYGPSSRKYLSFLGLYPSPSSFHTLFAYLILLSPVHNHSPRARADMQSRKRPFRLYQPRSRIHELGTTRLATRTIPRINGQRCHVEPLRPPKRSTKVTQSNL